MKYPNIVHFALSMIALFLIPDLLRFLKMFISEDSFGTINNLGILYILILGIMAMYYLFKAFKSSFKNTEKNNDFSLDKK